MTGGFTKPALSRMRGRGGRARRRYSGTGLQQQSAELASRIGTDLHLWSADRCSLCAVRDRAICAALSPAAREQSATERRTELLERGQTLVWEGEDPPLAGIVVEGVLKLSISLSDGREQIVGLVYPADFIGGPFGSRSQFSVTALTDSRVCVFSQAAFDRMLSGEPELARRLLQHTLEELNRTRRWMLLLGRKTARERIATFLLEMSQRLMESDPAAPSPLDRFELPVDRQQIADLLGLTIETVSRQLSQMRADGAIRMPRRRALEILDRAQLQEMSGD